MKSAIDKAPEPPPPIDNIHNDEGNKKIAQKTVTVSTNPNPITKLSQKKSPPQQKNAESETRTTTPTTLKTPSPSNHHNNGIDITQRTIEVANAVVINNNRITTPVTFQFRPPRHSPNFSISGAHQNIFEALKLLDPTLKFVTFHGTHIDTIEQFPSTQEIYTSTFKDIHKENDNSRVYVSHKIESAKPLGELKHGSRYCMSNIFDTLVKNNAFLSHKKFNSHKEHSIGFFLEVNPKITLRNEMRNRIQDQLMWIDLEDNETKKIMYPILDTKGKPTGSERIVLPAFDLYSKNIGHGNGDQRISTFAYEIRTSPENAITLKNILCKISMAASNELTFIPYGMDSLGTETRDITRSMIIKQNKFLTDIAVVPIFGVQKEEEEKFYDIFSNSLYFSGLEPTRKTQEDGKYLLLTTTANKYNAQLEADRLLSKHFTNANVARRSPTRRNVPIVQNHFSTYADALAKSPPPTQENYPMLTSPPLSIQRPYTISFSNNRNDDSTPPPPQKRKVTTDSNSLLTSTTNESTMAPITLDTNNFDLKEEVKAMLGEMKVEIMTQVDAAIKIQLSSVINEMKLQMKDMFKEMVKEISLPSNETATPDEEEKDDEEMEISSSDEDSELSTEQETSPDEPSLRAHKKKNSSKRKKSSARRSKRAK